MARAQAQKIQPPTHARPNLPPRDPGTPRSVAIIMDGNGRWAQARGKDRAAGHRRGAEAVRPIVTRCAELGVEALTLYSFSTENWSRSEAEVDSLMSLYVQYMVSERDLFLNNNVRFRPLGRREGLPPPVLEEMDRTVELTANNTGITLALAINYGSRQEITDAARAIAVRVREGELDPCDITLDTMADHLYTANLPDPDLLIRTAGEMRLSNYLLWQISYAEFHVADVFWPDFNEHHLQAAFEVYARRSRKFGSVR